MKGYGASSQYPIGSIADGILFLVDYRAMPGILQRFGIDPSAVHGSLREELETKLSQMPPIELEGVFNDFSRSSIPVKRDSKREGLDRRRLFLAERLAGYFVFDAFRNYGENPKKDSKILKKFRNVHEIELELEPVPDADKMEAAARGALKLKLYQTYTLSTLEGLYSGIVGAEGGRRKAKSSGTSQPRLLMD